MLVPLSVEVVLRAEHHPGDEVQNEVTVIEACGDRVMQHKDCYLSHPKTIGGSVTSESEDSFFPYLPGMIPFGLINATSGPAELKDARIPLTGFSLIVVVGALLIAEIPSRRRWRIFQVIVVLPSGALPMVTGGDDLPVIALMVLGLALATRRRPVWSGFAMGLAGTLKFTAWPLLILLALGEWDARGRRAFLRYSCAVVAVVVPVLGIGIGSNWHAFYINAIRFPLGLTKVKSPAASPLLGQELVTLVPVLQAGGHRTPRACGSRRGGLRAVEVVALEPAECRRFQRSGHAVGHCARPGDALWLPHLPARPFDLRRLAHAARLARLVPLMASRAVGDLEQPEREPHHS